MDTTSAVRGGLLVKSWAEIAALYRRLGEPEPAREMLRRVTDAWREGDPEYRDFARRAEETLQGITDRVSPPRT